MRRVQFPEKLVLRLHKDLDQVFRGTRESPSVERGIQHLRVGTIVQKRACQSRRDSVL